MRTTRTLMAAAAVLAALPATSLASGWPSPFRTQPHPVHTGPYLLGGHRNLPAFQAAPWYLYWPYDGHFLTPAPVHAPFYAPPVGGNFPVNPYFPAPHGYYGPMPGGPAPGGIGAFGGGGFGAPLGAPAPFPYSSGGGDAIPPIPPMPVAPPAGGGGGTFPVRPQ